MNSQRTSFTPPRSFTTPWPDGAGSSRGATLLSSTLLTLALVGCLGPREPGPSETEFGEIFYWQVVGSDVSFDSCTDAEAFRGDIEPPAFEENTFLIYRLSDDGTEAISQDCETTQADSCVDSEVGITFDVSGSQLVWDPEPEIEDISTSSCDREADQLWTLTDNGETLEADIGIRFGLVGDAETCDALQTEIQSQAPNGEGLDGCVVTLGLSTEFYWTDTP